MMQFLLGSKVTERRFWDPEEIFEGGWDEIEGSGSGTPDVYFEADI